MYLSIIQHFMSFFNSFFKERQIKMETEFQNAVGKGMGEVVRDISEFLSTPFVIHQEKQIDLCALLPDLNMAEQFSFALLSEAEAQGWEPDAAESFYRHAVALTVDDSVVNAMIHAFRDKSSDAFLAYQRKYGNRFSSLDGSYWATCLALGIDADQVGDILKYLRLFTVCLMEFAYMGDRNPCATYTWNYYESFRAMLDELTAPPEPAPKDLKVRAIGGTAGKRDGDSYVLSLGVDIHNPNPNRMARGIVIDITLKAKDGSVITVIRDQIQNIDPGTVYHYGVTRKIRGAATAGISVTAKASGFLKLSTPIMKHARLTSMRLSTREGGIHLSGTVHSEYDRTLRSIALHYQFLSQDNKILGGGNEWLFDALEAGKDVTFTSDIPVEIQNTAKAVYSVDFDAIELIK